MTDENGKKSEKKDHEKGALSSKKFVAFLVVETGFFVVMGMMIAGQEMAQLGGNMAFMVVAVTVGILASFYIGGQALVDKYVRVATIMAGHSEDPES